ncbi:MAG: M20/M25/M40 family metallo-hydrolase [Planctomycetes bacterium]|nr:M20/M25/M40 family metallo-hydrolase [Planctomycetota bacterium]
MLHTAPLLALVLGASALQAPDTVHHRLDVTLDPAARHLEVRDVVTLPAALRGDLEFELSDRLELAESTPEARVVSSADGRTTYAFDATSETLALHYAGTFDSGLSDEAEEYTRGFRESDGLVVPEGVYLHGGSGWVPSFGDGMITFEVAVTAPEDWHVISQGSGDSAVEPGRAHWRSDGPLEQVYLVGGPLLRTRDRAGDVETLVYLHEADDALSAKYLEATAQYLEMYAGLIGPYPYGKFALVENFWETGYGMPSFTLLGPQVVRFPFILHSSYPHEILHNWWGNSVFVDYASGNWCEGLTAYLADHLIQEQRGQGAQYRRGTLQKYRDYVKEGRDFPLADFHSRHSAATEAVGYGKALMTFHMLRRSLGDEAFVQGLQRFYGDERGRRASFDDLRRAMEAVSGRELGAFFTQWVDGLGAPKLALGDVRVEPTRAGFAVAGRLEQVQEGAPFALEVPLQIETEAGAVEVRFPVDERSTPFRLELPLRPLGVRVDPLFDVFRILDPRETPPSIGQLFGEPKVMAVLPSRGGRAERYRELVESWRSAEHELVIVRDDELDALPADLPVWVLGRENRFAAQLLDAQPGAEATDTGLTLAGEALPFADHAFVVVTRHPDDLERAAGLIVLEPDAALAGLARKLPHYGKYSYLAFEGDEPTNVVKGQWDAEGSPLVANLGGAALPPVVDARAALAETPPVFSAARLAAHVAWLAAPEREGRGLGSAGLDASADYVARAFAEVGLEPGGDAHGWFQEFTVAHGPDGAPVRAKNVVGVLRGKNAAWSDQSLVLGAHYDHLGFGWPEAHAGEEGRLHPGADDNASGVAVLIELARQLVAAGGGSRNLVVVAFSAEECGLLGSRHYVSAPRFPVAGMRGMINLDTVGRLGDGAISVLATGSADEWQHVFRGAGFVTGLPNKIVPGLYESSDQLSFLEAGVPAVQLFTGANADYHRTSDTPDKVSGADLVKVATFAREGVVYMLEREEPLTSRLDGAAATAPATAEPAGGRRVSFGSVPDFAFQGPGMRLDGVTEGSPAALAGLQAGDVLVRIDTTAIDGLRAFSDHLKTLSPGDTVQAVVLRDGAELTFEVTLVAR